MATNIGAVLKAEISRLSRKEIKSGMEGLQKASSAHRADLAAIKRRLASLEQFVKHMAKAMDKSMPAATKEDEPDQVQEHRRRFSSKRFTAERERLHLSAKQMGALVGVSQSLIYSWEAGKIRPSAEQLERIAKLRGIKQEDALKAIGEKPAGRAKRKSTPTA